MSRLREHLPPCSDDNANVRRNAGVTASVVVVVQRLQLHDYNYD